VRQGVLSPILFSVYIDDIICVLRNSGYGVYIGCVFIGCILYADDIILLSASCHGIQKLTASLLNYEVVLKVHQEKRKKGKKERKTINY